jgi:hypothetical protein
MDTEAAKIQKRLDQLEAERLILTIELRNALLRAANELLPTAIAQAKPQKASGKAAKRKPARAGSPALLRLLTRLAMRPIHIEHPK